MIKITLSGIVGWDIMPNDITASLMAAKGEDVEVDIASPGGDVFDGIEIYNAFRDYKRKYPKSQMLANIRGICASMGSYIAMNPAFDLVSAEDNAIFMIHNAWGGQIGDYRDMQKTADVLNGITDLLATVYSDKTKTDKKKIRSMMDDETWFFGEEIKTAGYVDEIITSEEKKDKEETVVSAKAQLSIALKKTQSRPMPLDQIAAMITDNKPQTPVSTTVENNNPATTQRETTQEASMTLNELLSANPAAKIEYDHLFAEHGKAQFIAGSESKQGIITGAAKFLTPDSQYGSTIKAIALDVLNGKKSLEALETTVSAFDALKESQASVNAQTESAAIGDTPGEQSPQLSPDGANKTEFDFEAMIKADKAKLGMEV